MTIEGLDAIRDRLLDLRRQCLKALSTEGVDAGRLSLLANVETALAAVEAERGDALAADERKANPGGWDSGATASRIHGHRCAPYGVSLRRRNRARTGAVRRVKEIEFFR